VADMVAPPWRPRLDTTWKTLRAKEMVEPPTGTYLYLGRRSPRVNRVPPRGADRRRA